jgi:hypothetical protein
MFNLSQTTSINRLEFSNLYSFIIFEYQNIFSTQLSMFTHLKSLEISFLDFHITQKFLDSLYNLVKLENLTICVKKFDVNLFNKSMDRWTSVSLTKFFIK